MQLVNFNFDWFDFAYIELNPELSGSRDDVDPLPINDGDVPVLLPPPLVPINIDRSTDLL